MQRTAPGWTVIRIESTVTHVTSCRSAASLEGGYPFDFQNDWTLEPQAQLVYQSVSLDSANDGVATVRFDDARSLAGRIGLRLAHDFALSADEIPRMGNWWLRADLWHEFLNDAETSLTSDDGPVAFHNDLGGFRLGLTTGLSARITDRTRFYASGNLRYRLDGSSFGYEGSMGVRVDF